MKKWRLPWERVRISKQLQIFENKTDKDITVLVEIYPDQYILKPNDVMNIAYDHESAGYGLHTIIYDGGLTIYLDHFDTAVATINGERVQPWSQ
jgi:hypothetical protein